MVLSVANDCFTSMGFFFVCVKKKKRGRESHNCLCELIRKETVTSLCNLV